MINSKVKENQANYVAIKVFKLKGFSDVWETKGSEISKVKWAIVLKQQNQKCKIFCFGLRKHQKGLYNPEIHPWVPI